MMYRNCVKRLLDFVLSLLGLLLLWPLMLIIALVIRLDSPGPALFVQQRLGTGRKPFRVLKFRTMAVDSEGDGLATDEHDSRITKVGRFLRKSSLDELPQLLNILAGQMAIIGPRPILDWQFEPFGENPEYLRRYEVRQGLFCTVDVKFRNNCERETQMQMDADYVKNLSFLTDITTFFGVLAPVLTGKNIYKEENTDE